jgi:flagellar FliL protein
MQWVVIVLTLTLISAATGGLLGLHLVSTAERVGEAQKAVAANRPVATQYSGSARLRRLSTVITNLASPSGTWARLEAALVLDDVRGADADVLASQVTEDITAYLRTVALTQLEGVRGLQYLREDLNERAKVRSNGKVRELIIETLVVQ